MGLERRKGMGKERGKKKGKGEGGMTLSGREGNDLASRARTPRRTPRNRILSSSFPMTTPGGYQSIRRRGEGERQTRRE